MKFIIGCLFILSSAVHAAQNDCEVTKEAMQSARTLSTKALAEGRISSDSYVTIIASQDEAIKTICSPAVALSVCAQYIFEVNTASALTKKAYNEGRVTLEDAVAIVEEQAVTRASIEKLCNLKK